MFKKILIANRGEIACRVIKTARKMGIATVAVYSEADRRALHVQLADEAVCIGPAPSKESYLAMDKIIAACKQTGAEAVHPGYGFLSENEEFARRLEEEGIVFIGPKHAAIAAMGDKIASKKLAMQAGVNTIPGYNEPIESAEEAVRIARDIGYPVMIKASAGGGGKGLRVAYDDAQCREGFESCRNEARNAFGDDRVFIEKFVEEPRHIEIQVFGDAWGNYVYLFERECSVQRRHQKVVEEAPSPFIDPDTRRAMGEQAVALARAVQYQSAGTVEFVVGKDKSFYFLEMNTRLQVEHPVTEMITGLDLVEWMIRIAAGEKLPLSQSELRIDGWAMECRINAEDPFRGFLPSTGRLVKFRPPAEVPGQVRVDTGVYEGGEISMYYDSMIAKLIVHGRDRLEAIERMQEALDAFVIRGIHSNIPFQAALMQHPRFREGRLTTGFIAEEFPHGFTPEMVPHEDPLMLRLILAAVEHKWRLRNARLSGQMNGRRYAPTPSYHVIDAHGSTPATVEALSDVRFVVRSGDRVLQIDFDPRWRLGEIVLQVRIGDAPMTVQLEREGILYVLRHHGAELRARVLPAHIAALWPLMPLKSPPDMSKFLLSPMPGLLREVAVAEGQEVKAGEKLAVIEAMKMENILRAEQDGKVKKIVAKPGASLAVDEVILEFE
ncbi:acetyl-CoA carboxylase biotin carboxylase subunit [Tepidiphilus margaritifer]|uniref:acetyl-CoA carboxylase biotin carboxylase subunit n=1 Tax=Tepidiphilus margaritifer TaxID=203471 RepID=UPI00041A61B9|nr:acetyl-CoA carboxylase biotin carboxylase subunit [Tepidiphilus margaritifer]